MIRVLHTIQSLEQGTGGPARSVPGLCRALQAQPGMEVAVAVQQAPTHPSSIGVPLQPFPQGKLPTGYALLHDHALWLPCNQRIARLAQREQVPQVVSPRGMLEPWALNHRKWKKRLAWHLYQRRNLGQAACLHATATSEAEQFRRLGLRNPIAVIPNGVSLPDPLPTRPPATPPYTLLFLSRIQKKKGLLNLVAAWAQVKALLPEVAAAWRIRIVGPEEDGHRQEVQAAAQAAGIAAQISLEEGLSDTDKWQAYVEADLFALPTYSENFGIVIAEALAAGLPVITTQGAPWAELETHQCGWWVEIGVPPLVTALSQAIQLTPEERAAMGARGQALVQAQFTWPSIARQMAQTYAWLLTQGDRPDCVTES